MGRDARLKRERRNARIVNEVEAKPKRKAWPWYVAGLAGFALAGIAVPAYLFYPKEKLPEMTVKLPVETAKIVIESSKDTQAVSTSEINASLENIVSRFGSRLEERPRFIYAETQKWFVPLKDEEFGKKMIEIYEKTIKSLEKYLEGTPLKVPRVSFIIADKDTVFSSKDSIIYLTQTSGRDELIHFECRINGAIEKITTIHTLESSSVGWSLTASKTETGYVVEDITVRDAIILQMEAKYRAALAENAFVELLHKLVGKYISEHLKKESNSRQRKSFDEIVEIQRKWQHRDETFVHGISILLLPEIVEEYNVPLSYEEMQARFADYEQNDNYKGTNAMAQRIKSIGVKKAIDLLMRNPEELFR